MLNNLKIGVRLGIGFAITLLLVLTISAVSYSGLNKLDRHYLNLRGEVLPFVNLRDLFELEGEAPARRSVVVVQYAGNKVGIVVDKLHGEFQTVIKPLGVLFRHLRGIGGSTILGSGEVALILDVPALVGIASRLEERALAIGSTAGSALEH